jgi:AraC family transcriptional regulator, regulatory protein of adaptative response / methylated-DNA-[protein]-cysteine methyltransferase
LIAWLILVIKTKKMSGQEITNFNRIEEAIGYISDNFRNQPSLDEIAGKIHLSPSHFQRLFTDWAGVSPKKFLQYISIEHAKQVLKDKQATLFDAAFETGLSGTGRLHDLFINIEGMTPGEYKNGGENLLINYSYAETPFGNILVASTPKGICYMAFADDEQQALAALQANFPNARYKQMLDLIQQNALYIFSHDWTRLDQIKLHLKGTVFQLKVWETLLKIPMGRLTTYGNIAQYIQQPKASRAVGTAVGDNPVAFLIPCHRVIQSTGVFGQYHWGSKRKTAMIGWEAAKINAPDDDTANN